MVIQRRSCGADLGVSLVPRSHSCSSPVGAHGAFGIVHGRDPPLPIRGSPQPIIPAVVSKQPLHMGPGGSTECAIGHKGLPDAQITILYLLVVKG